MSDKLNPCPFCGGESYVEHLEDGYGVCCANQRCACVTLKYFKSMEEAIAAWNTRPEQQTEAILCNKCKEKINGK